MSATHLSDLYALARQDFRERWADYREDFGPQQDDPGDVIHEVADSSVPVYTADLLRLATEDVELATAEPECGPAFAGSSTPANIIAANVYEALTAELWAEWGRVQEEHDHAAHVSDAEQEGYEAGTAAGSWIIDGNTPEEAARRILAGIEDGDPAILEQIPPSPLSGEWASGLLPRDVLGWYELEEDAPGADDVLVAFEDGYSRGAVDAVSRSAQALLGEDA